MRGRLLGLGLLLVPMSALADGPERHDGFALRLDLGLGYTKVTTNDLATDYSVSGSGGTFGIAIGGAVTENLILFGELFDDVAVNPTVESGGVEQSTTDVNAAVVGIGPGIAYYFMPTNLYISGTLAFSQVNITENGHKVAESDTGLGFNFMIGKEWWVSDQWGLGIAGQIFVASIPEKNNDRIRYSSRAFALAFSATYN